MTLLEGRVHQGGWAGAKMAGPLLSSCCAGWLSPGRPAETMGPEISWSREVKGQLPLKAKQGQKAWLGW